MTFERGVLGAYLEKGKLVQIATLDRDGSPAVCNVWYAHTTQPDRIIFMSRLDRAHSENIRKDPRVAGAIIANPLEGLGQSVQGLTFKGRAMELNPSENPTTVDLFVKRWPRALPPLSSPGMTCLYEVSVTEWQLFDEVNFPEEPKRIIAAE